MKLNSLEKLYVHELKDLFSAESQWLEALQVMEEAASDEELKQLFADHSTQTEIHIRRLESIFKGLDIQPSGHRCVGMEGLVQETAHVLNDDIESHVRDAALVAAAQRIKHYEIAGYGTARAYAEQLGRRSEADILQETLNEEGLYDQSLTRLAERRLNFLAMMKTRTC